MPDANGRFRGITVPRLPWLDGLAETQADLARMVSDWAAPRAGECSVCVGVGCSTCDNDRGDLPDDTEECPFSVTWSPLPPDDENEVAP